MRSFRRLQAPRAVPNRQAKVQSGEFRNGCQDSDENEPFAVTPSFWSDQFDISLFGIGHPSVGDRVDLMSGELSGEVVVGYFKNDDLVGACGIGLRAQVQSLREKLGKGAL